MSKGKVERPTPFLLLLVWMMSPFLLLSGAVRLALFGLKTLNYL